MTLGEIVLIVALKGAVVVALARLGWWPDWEQRARDREDEKLVLRAYHQWRKDAGPEAAAKLRLALQSLASRPKNFRPVQK